MGNKSSSPGRFAEWKSEIECEHPRSEYKVNEIRWIRVPMANGFTRGATQTGRVVVGVVTLGLSTWLNGGIKDLSHECIEIRTICERCGCHHWFTAEIMGEGDKQFNCGYYSKFYNARSTYEPSWMTLDYVEEKYKEMSSHYDLVSANCCHWSSKLWNKL